MKFYQLLILVFVLFLAGSYYLGYTPLFVSLVFVLASLIAYSLYAKDKAAATSQAWRVPESTLHTAALFCGWPGALFAQQRLRHKTKKASFRRVFWVTVLINLAGLVWLHSPQGSVQVRTGMHKLEGLAASHIQYQPVLYTLTVLTELRANDRPGFFW